MQWDKHQNVAVSNPKPVESVLVLSGPCQQTDLNYIHASIGEIRTYTIKINTLTIWALLIMFINTYPILYSVLVIQNSTVEKTT